MKDECSSHTDLRVVNKYSVDVIKHSDFLDKDLLLSVGPNVGQVTVYLLHSKIDSAFDAQKFFYEKKIVLEVEKFDSEQDFGGAFIVEEVMES